MAYNIGITPIGYYPPTLNNRHIPPKIFTGSEDMRTGYSPFLPYVDIQQSSYGLDIPTGLNAGLLSVYDSFIYKPLPNSGITNPFPGWFTVMGRIGTYYICKGGSTQSTQTTWFIYKESDPIGTYRTFTGLPSTDTISYNYAVFRGNTFCAWYTSTSGYVYLYTVTISNGEVSISNQTFVISGVSDVRDVSIYIKLRSILNDGNYLFSVTYTTNRKPRFFIGDPNTLRITEDSLITTAITESGFYSISGHTPRYKVVASLGRRVWLLQYFTVGSGSTSSTIFRLCMFDPNTLLSQSVLVPKILFWGEYGPSEVLISSGGNVYNSYFVPTLIGTVYLINYRDNNTEAWGITELTLGPTDPAPPEPSDDPYQEEGGISDYGGGGGGVDMTESDNINFPTPPSNLIADCGLISFYNPTKQEIINLADQIMSQSIAGAIKNIFTDPLEGIVSLALFNGSPPLSGSRGEIKVGLIGTGVTANLLSSSYMTLDCGSITVGDKTKGNALDFSPYTTAQLYLPFIGFASVSPDDFMYSTVHIKYNIDLLSGSCVAMVRIQKDGKNDLLYTYSGNVLTSIPLNGKNYKEIIKATATITAAVAVGGVAGGIATGAATGALSSAAKAGFVESMEQFQTAGVSAATKPSITRSGRLDMSIGAMSPKKPYLVFSRPAQSLPEKFKSYRGYPSNVTTKLSELVGYTEVQDVHLTGIPATTEELDLILEHLKGGIII